MLIKYLTVTSFFVTREEDEAKDVGAVGELASDLPAVEVGRITQASAVVESLVARIGQNGPILLQGCLEKRCCFIRGTP